MPALLTAGIAAILASFFVLLWVPDRRGITDRTMVAYTRWMKGGGIEGQKEGEVWGAVGDSGSAASAVNSSGDYSSSSNSSSSAGSEARSDALQLAGATPSEVRAAAVAYALSSAHVSAPLAGQGTSSSASDVAPRGSTVAANGPPDESTNATQAERVSVSESVNESVSAADVSASGRARQRWQQMVSSVRMHDRDDEDVNLPEAARQGEGEREGARKGEGDAGGEDKPIAVAATAPVAEGPTQPTGEGEGEGVDKPSLVEAVAAYERLKQQQRTELLRARVNLRDAVREANGGSLEAGDSVGEGGEGEGDRGAAVGGKPEGHSAGSFLDGARSAGLQSSDVSQRDGGEEGFPEVSSSGIGSSSSNSSSSSSGSSVSGSGSVADIKDGRIRPDGFDYALKLSWSHPTCPNEWLELHPTNRVTSLMTLARPFDLPVPPDRRLVWRPVPGSFLMAMCAFGRMTNRLICLQNYILAATLLNRTLVVPYADLDSRNPQCDAHGVDRRFRLDLIADVGQINGCFRSKLQADEQQRFDDGLLPLFAISLEEYANRYSSRESTGDNDGVGSGSVATGSVPGDRSGAARNRGGSGSGTAHGDVFVDAVHCWARDCHLSLRKQMRLPPFLHLPDFRGTWAAGRDETNSTAGFVSKMYAFRGGADKRLITFGDLFYLHGRVYSNLPPSYHAGLSTGWYESRDVGVREEGVEGKTEGRGRRLGEEEAGRSEARDRKQLGRSGKEVAGNDTGGISDNITRSGESGAVGSSTPGTISSSSTTTSSSSTGSSRNSSSSRVDDPFLLSLSRALHNGALRSLLWPHRAIASTALRFVSDMIGRPFVALHLRRGDMFRHCVVAGGCSSGCSERRVG